MIDHIKALSVNNVADLVYAEQCFHEVGMLDNFYVVDIGGKLLFVPDGGWIVWFPNEIEFTEMSDSEFRSKYIPYEELPPKMKAICDAHPTYKEWVANCNKEHEANHARP